MRPKNIAGTNGISLIAIFYHKQLENKPKNILDLKATQYALFYYWWTAAKATSTNG